MKQGKIIHYISGQIAEELINHAMTHQIYSINLVETTNLSKLTMKCRSNESVWQTSETFEAKPILMKQKRLKNAQS